MPLRVVRTPGTSAEYRRRAPDDLGFAVRFQELDGLEVQRRAVTAPASFDVIEHWSLTTELAWTASAIQPIEVERIANWSDVLALENSSNLMDELKVGKGVSPREILFIQPDGELGATASPQVSMVPTTYQFDSFGYHSSLRRTLFPGEVESWGWLLDDRWRGLTAITAHAPIAIVEMALASQARGLMTFEDIGNLQIHEIDRLIALLIDYKHRGHFRAFWETSSQSAALLRSGDVVIESMWPGAATETAGSDIVTAVPAEGTRAWLIGLSISSRCTGEQLERAYAYINWSLSGWSGAHATRYGLYATAPGAMSKYLTEDEWDFWYCGKPARSEMLDLAGRRVAGVGDVRVGGSCVRRIREVAVWNTFMNEYNYLVRRWRDFMTA